MLTSVATRYKRRLGLVSCNSTILSLVRIFILWRNGLDADELLLVVGAQERDSRTVNIRNRDDQATQAKGDLIPLDEAIAKLAKLRDGRGLVNAI